MEIKILVKENQKKDLERFIETCKQRGFAVTHEGGGKIPNWSGWFAELKGERWQKDNMGDRQSNITDVRLSLPSREDAYKEGLNRKRRHEKNIVWKAKIFAAGAMWAKMKLTGISDVIGNDR